VYALFAVPKNTDDEPGLFLMLEAMDEVFETALWWCYDGPDCMLTWPQQLALSRFHTAAAPDQKIRAFNPKKEPETLTIYFGYWKQFLTYCYRVAYRGGHFRAPNDEKWTPETCIRLTHA
jgi:hypothetical protein